MRTDSKRSQRREKRRDGCLTTLNVGIGLAALVVAIIGVGVAIGVGYFDRSASVVSIADPKDEPLAIKTYVTPSEKLTRLNNVPADSAYVTNLSDPRSISISGSACPAMSDFPAKSIPASGNGPLLELRNPGQGVDTIQSIDVVVDHVSPIDSAAVLLDCAVGGAGAEDAFSLVASYGQNHSLRYEFDHGQDTLDSRSLQLQSGEANLVDIGLFPSGSGEIVQWHVKITVEYPSHRVQTYRVDDHGKPFQTADTSSLTTWDYSPDTYSWSSPNSGGD